MPSIPEHITQQLAALEQQHQLRSLQPQTYQIDFTSNDYLGLGKTPRKTDSGDEGAGGSRLLAGNWPAHTAVEGLCATEFRGEGALLFGSGYMANLGVLSCLPHRNDTVLFDEKCHASIKDGFRLGLAKHQSYRHNDLGDLREKLAKVQGQAWVVTEGLFSMDGTLPDLGAMAELCKEMNAHLIVDEAHSTGILGPEGRGACAMYGVDSETLVRIHAFGKAVGRAGAVAIAPQSIIQYLINRSRPFIYTTAMPPSAAISLFHSIRRCLTAQPERDALLDRISYAQTLPILGKFTLPQSPIIPVILPGNERIRQAADYLLRTGLDVRPILSPTVPAGTERLRIVLHAFNSRADIDLLEKGLAHCMA